MTERLYYADSYLRAFDAEVVDLRPHGSRHAAVLSRTAFFPTSGGQPHDTGTLDGAQVIDVIDGDPILHVVTAAVAGRVHGEVHWERRFDHMQQHTGQHVLSQAALRRLGAATVSVHFGEETATLDLALADLDRPRAAAVEDLANAVVFEDRPVLVRQVEESELVALGLRRPTKRQGLIRVVEVEGFDRSACGGTHVRRTGEIGCITIRRWERYKGGVRIEFLCGWRALRDARWKSALVGDLAGAFTVKDREVGDAVARLQGQLRDRERALAEVRERLLRREAADVLAAAGGEPKVVAAVLDRPADEAGALAGMIIASGPCVVVLGATGGRIILARSAEIVLDAGALLRQSIGALGGRGGGRPEFAQGAVPPDRVQDAVAAAREAVLRQLGRR